MANAEFGVLPLLLESKQEINVRLSAKPRLDTKHLKLDAITKWLGVTGVAIFGVLFVAYFQFYSTLGVEPEDIGINYTYVLARSIGLLLILVAIAAYIELIRLLTELRARSSRPLADTPPHRGRVTSRLRAATAPLGLKAARLKAAIVAVTCLLSGIYYLNIHRQQHSPLLSAFYLGIAIFSFALALLLIVMLLRIRVASSVFFGFPILSTLLGLSAGFADYAHNLGGEVLQGYEAEPVNLFSLPLLDIQARYVTAQWVGPSAQRPEMFGSRPQMCALDLGRSSTTHLLLIHPPGQLLLGEGHLARLPISMVAISYVTFDDCPDLMRRKLNADPHVGN